MSDDFSKIRKIVHEEMKEYGERVLKPYFRDLFEKNLRITVREEIDESIRLEIKQLKADSEIIKQNMPDKNYLEMRFQMLTDTSPKHPVTTPIQNQQRPQAPPSVLKERQAPTPPPMQ